jgi:tetratricopeptide (TPR) repeat protein
VQGLIGRPSRRGVLAGAAALASMGLVGAGGLSRWKLAESPRFQIYSDGDEAVTRAYALKLETFDSLLRSLQGLPPGGLPPRKLPIYLVKGTESLERVWAGAGELIRGFYSPGSTDIFAVAIRDRKDDDTLLHEYTHHFMFQNAPFGYPAWLIEGYAEFYGATVIAGDKIEVGRWNQNRVDFLSYETWIPITDLLGKNLWELKTGQAQVMLYAQGWLLTHWLLTDGFTASPVRYRQLQAYLKAVGSGVDSVKAMREATGLDAAAMEKTLRAYLKGGLKYTPITRTGAVPPTVTVTPLAASADDLLLERQRLRRGVSRPDKDDKSEDKDGARAKAEKAADDFLKLVRERAAKYPGDALAAHALARAELSLGDKAAAAAVLARRLAADPNDVEALELTAEIKIDEADALMAGDVPDTARAKALAREAVPFLGRAYKQDPSRYQTLFLIAESGRYLDKSYPSDNSLEALLAAFEIAPQVSNIRLAAARGMIRRSRYKAARSLLNPLANDPHAAGAAEAARALLRQIDGFVDGAGS